MSAPLETYRGRLESERQGLLHELGHIQDRTARREKAQQGGSESQHDDHMAELASEHYEREKDLIEEANLRVLLEQADKALGKLESGTYGTCDACGGAIAVKRLEALPSANLCIECQNLAES